MIEIGEFKVVLRRALVLAGSDPHEAVRALEEGLVAARQRGTPVAVAVLAKNAAAICYTAGRLELATRYYEEAQASSPSDATLWIASGEVRLTMGHEDAAKHDYTQAVALARQSGDTEMADLAESAAAKIGGRDSN